MCEDNSELRITAVRALNSRSLRLEFNNGTVRLFDRARLRGPQYVGLMNEAYFTNPVIADGDLTWQGLDILCEARFIYDRSVPYDDHATQREYVPSRNAVIGERIAMVLFPIMAIAGITGIIWWYIHQ